MLNLDKLNQQLSSNLPPNLHPKIHLPLHKKRIQNSMNPFQRFPAPGHRKIAIGIHIRRQTRQRAAPGVSDLHPGMHPNQIKTRHIFQRQHILQLKQWVFSWKFATRTLTGFYSTACSLRCVRRFYSIYFDLRCNQNRK